MPQRLSTNTKVISPKRVVSGQSQRRGGFNPPFQLSCNFSEKPQWLSETFWCSALPLFMNLLLLRDTGFWFCSLFSSPTLPERIGVNSSPTWASKTSQAATCLLGLSLICTSSLWGLSGEYTAEKSSKHAMVAQTRQCYSDCNRFMSPLHLKNILKLWCLHISE